MKTLAILLLITGLLVVAISTDWDFSSVGKSGVAVYNSLGSARDHSNTMKGATQGVLGN